MSDQDYLSIDDRFQQLRLGEAADGSEEKKQPSVVDEYQSAHSASSSSPVIHATYPTSHAYQPHEEQEYKDEHKQVRADYSYQPASASAASAFPPSALPHPVSLPLPSMTRLYASAPFQPTKELGPPVVIIKQLQKSYTLPGRTEVVRALKNIDLSTDTDFYPIMRGEFVMIRGPSGGGKTTLLNILGTIDEPTAGSIELLGEQVDASSTDSYLASLRLRKIGFVFQTFNLLATMSAFENVELPMTILGERSAKECKQRAMQLLDMVGLQDRYGHLPSELSGGEQQRVTIARALSNEPELLLLDEPTGDLDTRNTVDVMDLIMRVNLEQKTTCIMVTHNPDLECQNTPPIRSHCCKLCRSACPSVLTHQPHSTFVCLLGYADRILYVEDGQFKKQAINRQQMKLDYVRNKQHTHTSQSRGRLIPGSSLRLSLRCVVVV